MSNFVSIIIVAVFGVIGNIIYFEYRLKKEHRKEIDKEQLTKLLLPLYIIFKTDELELIEWLKNENADPYEYESDKPDRLFKPVKKILDTNLYLADEDLQKHSLLFIEWAFKEDSYIRFQKLHSKGLKQDKVLDDFKKLIYKKYNEKRNKYLK